MRPTHEIILVTGSTHFTAEAVASLFGVEQFCSSVAAAEAGILTGKMDSYLATRHEKKEAIRHLTAAHPLKGSFAFGDSEGDIEMLRAVEYPICILPTPGLRRIAEEQGWVIVDSEEELASGDGLQVVRDRLLS